VEYTTQHEPNKQKGKEMKHTTITLLSVIALTIMGYAGGNIEVPETESINIPIVEETKNFYIGLGLSKMSLRNDFSDEEFSASGIMLQLGYQINPYVAIEGRYTKHVGNLDYDHGKVLTTNISDYDGDFSNIAVYVKPMYSIESFQMYGLLGYGAVKLTNIPLGGSPIAADRSENSFQWGVGLGYDVLDNVSVFVDYVRFYDDDGFNGRATQSNIVSDAWTLGVSYTF